MIDNINKGDTVSVNGISGVYFCEPKFGVFAMRPVPSVKMTDIEAIEFGGRGLHFYVLGHTALYHIEHYELEDVTTNARIVLMEKTITHLLAKEKVHKRLVK